MKVIVVNELNLPDSEHSSFIIFNGKLLTHFDQLPFEEVKDIASDLASSINAKLQVFTPSEKDFAEYIAISAGELTDGDSLTPELASEQLSDWNRDQLRDYTLAHFAETAFRLALADADSIEIDDDFIRHFNLEDESESDSVHDVGLDAGEYQFSHWQLLNAFNTGEVWEVPKDENSKENYEVKLLKVLSY
tara:strand:- start:422 stop:994 length:573 start_codon:yes stop_codon:yes gene_type:complete